MNWKAQKKHRHEAMAAPFEIILPGVKEPEAASIAMACFDELDRIESEISSWQGGSDISMINAAKAGEAVSIGLATLACLEVARQLFKTTLGTFDITIGPLLKIWRTKTGEPRTPSDAEVEDARARTGFGHIQIDAENHTVTKDHAKVRIDLGGIGKGFGVDEIARLLREDYEIETFLINGGTSTVLVKGPPCILGAGHSVLIENQALSGSGFDVKGAHIIDPRSGRPVQPATKQAWAVAPDAATADGLSTAFVVLSEEEIKQVCADQKDIGAKLELKKKRYKTLGAWPT